MRRCTTDSCLTTASARKFSLDAPVATILTNPRQDWSRVTSGHGRVRVARDLSVDWSDFTSEKYLFTHCTIISSVATQKNGYYIDPVCNELVNNNGNAWTNGVLMSTFRSFVGGENYLEHVQIPELSKGKILDAVLRPVVYKDKNGREANVYYSDILVATNRKHTGLVRDIESGELVTLSMGCGIAGTPVTMADGATKPVDEIVVGDKVITHTGGVAEVESTRVRETSPGELRRLSLTGIPDAYVTGEHPYWALTGYDVCVGCGKEMKRSDSTSWSLNQVLHPWCSSSCRQSHVNSNPKCKRDFEPVAQKIKFDWVPLKELKKGDYVAVPLGRPVRKRSSVERFKARLIGYYAAEGNLQRARNGQIRAVEFTLHADEPAGDEIMELAREWGISEDKIYSQVRTRESGVSRRVVIHDPEMAQWLQETCGEHCEEKRLAPWVIELADESILEVLGSYIEGDGHCRKDTARFTTASCSRALSEQVLTMMMAVGIPANISLSEKKGKKPAWYVNTRKGYSDALSGYTYKFRPQQENTSRVSDVGGYMLRRVKSNVSVDLVCDVFNIHVVNEDNDHSYIMNGVAVHNCLAEYVTCSRCGVVLSDGQANCHHLDHELLTTFVDEDGVERVVAELCGRMIEKDGQLEGDPDSVKFIEASWVKHPAFTGAVLNHYVSEVPEVAKILQLPTSKLAETVDDLFKLRVADKMGMIVLKVACHELMRRRREAMIARVARGRWV